MVLNSIVHEKKSHIEVISIDQLKLINYEFGPSYMMSDFL